MKIIYLALKDLLQIVRDRQAALFLVALPIGFTLLFGFAFGGFSSDSVDDARLPVGLVDHDQGLLEPFLMGMLDSSTIFRVETLDLEVDDPDELVSEGEYSAVIVIPQGYSAGMIAGDSPGIDLITDISTDAGRTVQGEVQAITFRVDSAVQTAIIGGEIFEENSDSLSDGERQAYLEDTIAESLQAWASPPVSISGEDSRAVSDDTGQSVESENAFSQSSPGMMAQFAIAGLMGAASILVVERKERAMRRLLTTAITRVQILLGHYLAMFVMILVQLLILMIFGQMLLRLDYFSQPLASMLLAIATALFSASLGLLIGALARSEEQVIVFAMIPMFVLSGLGGAWVPLEIMPEGFQNFARLTPVAFVMDGYQDIIIRGQGTEEIIVNILALLAMAGIIFAFASWRFRYE